MAATPTTAEILQEINDSDYQQAISKGLDKSYADAHKCSWSFRLNRDRLIIFSDLHKGARNRADDFRHCERAYNAALAYYYSLGYCLVELGDVEELWEERPKTVINSYERTMRLSAKFHIDPDKRGARYLRIWGNHDDHWNRRDEVDKHLTPIYCPAGTPGLDVYGSVRIAVEDSAGERIGEFFLAHGHQGTFESDKVSWASRVFVRYLWRPFQRLTNTSRNTPAKNWILREKHNLAMYRWASGLKRTDFVFVAGHTHRPVFLGQSNPERLTDAIRRAEAEWKADDTRLEPLNRIAELSAQLEWTRAEGPQDTGKEGIVDEPRACYFNSGCAAYSDGDITGIELAEDEIRLVRWPDDDDTPLPKILDSMKLRALFAG